MKIQGGATTTLPPVANAHDPFIVKLLTFYGEISCCLPSIMFLCSLSFAIKKLGTECEYEKLLSFAIS